MQELVKQLAKAQESGGNASKQNTAGEALNSTIIEKGEAYSDKRLAELERQVAEMTERRFEHLESIQHQQMQMQVCLLEVLD